MTNCIESPLRKDKDGYPRIKHDKRVMSAARLLYYIMYGDIPVGKMLLHTCDNPSCVNPDHLYLGDNVQNMKDKVSRGRVAGDNHPRAKVTEEQITEMVSMFNNEALTQAAIGKVFGICQSQVSAILNGKRLGTKVFVDDNR